MAGEWTVLARNGEETSVSRCPAGHIHLEQGTTSLRLDDECFLALAEVVCAAARKLGWPQGSGPVSESDRRGSGVN